MGSTTWCSGTSSVADERFDRAGDGVFAGRFAAAVGRSGGVEAVVLEDADERRFGVGEAGAGRFAAEGMGRMLPGILEERGADL
ncbi:MAG: hypothetical protein JST73_03080, partial [Actinobacteria bacterium]|nr:hypothetical protein [Actinomycetota bacterium]